MEDIKEKAGGLKEKTQNLTDHVSDLLESYYKLGILNVTEKGTEIASLTITLFVVSFLLLCALLFIGFGVAWWLGGKIEQHAYRFYDRCLLFYTCYCYYHGAQKTGIVSPYKKYHYQKSI